MQFLGLNLAALTACLTAALPSPQGSSPAYMRSSTFGLVLHATAPYDGLVLRAEPVDTDSSSRALLFERPSAFTPSPAYLNGTYEQLNATGGFAYLNFLNDDKDCKDDYGVFLPDIGDGRGFLEQVSAGLGIGTPDFNAGDGELYAQLRAAPNQFVACNTTVNSTHTPVFGLGWANLNENGSFPAGCVPAQLRVVSLEGYA